MMPTLIHTAVNAGEEDIASTNAYMEMTRAIRLDLMAGSPPDPQMLTKLTLLKQKDGDHRPVIDAGETDTNSALYADIDTTQIAIDKRMCPGVNPQRAANGNETDSIT